MQLCADALSVLMKIGSLQSNKSLEWLLKTHPSFNNKAQVLPALGRSLLRCILFFAFSLFLQVIKHENKRLMQCNTELYVAPSGSNKLSKTNTKKRYAGFKDKTGLILKHVKHVFRHDSDKKWQPV